MGLDFGEDEEAFFEQRDVRETPKDTEGQSTYRVKNAGTQTLTNAYQNITGITPTITLKKDTTIAIMASVELTFAAGIDPPGGAIIIRISGADIPETERIITRDWNQNTGGVNKAVISTQYVVTLLGKATPYLISVRAKSTNAGAGSCTIVGQVANVVIFEEARIENA